MPATQVLHSVQSHPAGPDATPRSGGQISEAELVVLNAHLRAAFAITNARFPGWITERLVQILTRTIKMQRAATRGPVFCTPSYPRTIVGDQS